MNSYKLMKINPDDSATGFAFNNDQRGHNTGLTIRTQIAAMAMQGLLANSNNYGTGIVASNSVAYADALIEELNKTT